jgi:ADP-ribose pyrophosphatase YjhB (NUDIX family)
MTPEHIPGRDIQGNPATLDVDRLQWRPSVYGLAIQDNQLLVLDNPRTENYELPGGGVDIHESLTDALQREIMEECNVSVTVGDLLHMDEQFFLTPGGNHWHTLRFFYRVTVTGGTLRVNDPDEHSTNPHWHALDELTATNIAVHWQAIQRLMQEAT